MIGRVLDGKYEVVGPLGEGGMAVVYRGRRLADARQVAIKVLREQYAHDTEFVARFEPPSVVLRSAKGVHVLPQPVTLAGDP